MWSPSRSVLNLAVVAAAVVALPSCKNFHPKAQLPGGMDAGDARDGGGSGGGGGAATTTDGGDPSDGVTIGTTPRCIAGSTRLCKDDPDLAALGNCADGMEVCAAGSWGSCSVRPAARDTCALLGDDATCNGSPNEGCPCTDGSKQACGPAADVGLCRRGTQTCAGGIWGSCVGAMLAAGRDCTSAADNNCDGVADNVLDAVCVCAPSTLRPCDSHAGLDGKGRCRAGSQSCVLSTDTRTSAWGACSGSVGPAPSDSCSPGNDDNCNGSPNEGCSCVEGNTQFCGPNADVGICKRGMQTCTGGAWGACVGAVPAAGRDCTSPADNNCDGVADNTVDAVCSCGFGITRACNQHPGQDGNGRCKAGSQGCTVAADKRSSDWSACVGAVGPAPADTCDATNDDNCNGIPHDACTCVNGTSQACGPATIGICKRGTQVCANSAWGTCTGAVATTTRDCTSALDNDCNGIPDNRDSTCVCAAGTTGPCPGNNNPPCQSGTRTCNLSADRTSTSWGTTCTGQVLPQASDSCVAGNDSNCNLIPNEGCACTTATPPRACPCGTQACVSGQFGPCIVSCPGTCIAGACCVSPRTPQCGGTMCCASPPANSSFTCTGTACASALTHPVTCGGNQVAGSWNFESSTNENWGREANAFGGATASMSTAHPRGVSRVALGTTVNSPYGDVASFQAYLVVSPCGSPLNLQGRSLSAWIYIEGTAPFAIGFVSAIAGSAGLQAGFGSTANFVNITASMYNQWTQVFFTFDASNSAFASVGALGISFDTTLTSFTSPRVVGYIDDVVLDPP